MFKSYIYELSVAQLFSFHIQVLKDYLDSNPDPDLMVSGSGLWSIMDFPDQEMAMSDFHKGLKILYPVVHT